MGGPFEATEVRPDVVSFTALISSCEKGGEWEVALNFFEQMPEAQCCPNLVTWNASISCCEKGLHWPAALHMFSSMRQASIQPDLVSFSAAITACEKGAQWQLALRLFTSMESTIRPDSIVLNAAISACEKALQWEHALHLMHSAQLMDAVSSASALNACAKAAQWTRALHLFEKQESPNVIIYMSLLSSFCDQDLGYKSLTQLELHQHLLKLTPHVLEVEGLLPLQWWVSVIHPELRRVSPGLREASRMAAMRISRAGRAQLELRRRDLPVLRRCLKKWKGAGGPT